MKGILEFTLPEESDEHLTAINASKYKNFIWELDQFLRNQIKYNEKLHIHTVNAFQLIRDKIREECANECISIE
jgi:hypothetical protein